MVPAHVTRERLIFKKDRVIEKEMQRQTEFMKVIEVRYGVLVMLISLRHLHLKFQTLGPNKTVSANSLFQAELLENWPSMFVQCNQTTTFLCVRFLFFL